MAKKITSTKEKKEKLETDVILVVKGAGEQAEDEHLNLFLRGFWPAVVSLDKDATIDQVTDHLEGYESSPHNKEGHKHLTEIRASYRGRKRRIWIKESYWEAETLPSDSLGNLSNEWHMSSFVFANLFQEILFKRNTKKLKESRLKAAPYEFRRGINRERRVIDDIGNYFSYLILFLLVFLPFTRILTPSSHSWLNGMLLVSAVGAIWALAPAIELSVGLYEYKKQEKGNLKRLPGLPSWILIALIFLLVTNPGEYIRFVLSLLALQLTLIIARELLWRYRNYANSDVDIADYYSYNDPESNKKMIGKVDEDLLTRIPFTPLLYRYFIFLTLPVAFVGTILVGILKWTRVLGGIGEALDKGLSTALVGYLDDVVNYAMDPAQSHRVRSAVKSDIVYFQDKHPEVNRIHVIAHSQGTPITYETLFHFLENKYQKKIYTYVTIGSVLSYYHQARGVLDPIYYERFPISPEKRQDFPIEFKWMNFWNFTDPITEFYGLDEYTQFEDAPPLDQGFKRSRTSPTNIRTRSSISKNHGEYWDNIEQIHLPFAKRVLSQRGQMKPEEWNPDQVSDKNPHHIAVLLLWLFIVFGVYWMISSGNPKFLFDYFALLQKNAQDVFNTYQGLFASKASAEPSLLHKVLKLAASDPVKYLWQNILMLLGIYAVIDWLAQIWRAFQIKRD